MTSNFFQRTDCYVIAEVGQNHQGSLEESLKYIAVFAGLGADAVKFQMRNNKFLFDGSIYNSPNNSGNSIGRTYGEHREFLELDVASKIALKERCSHCNVDFIITPFDEPSLEACISLQVDAIKVASFDLGNFSFLDKIARAEIPVVISSGVGKFGHITSSIMGSKFTKKIRLKKNKAWWSLKNLIFNFLRYLYLSSNLLASI